MKIGQKLKKVIGSVAPTIGMAVGGPFGGMAGKLLQGALGVDSEDAAITMLETNPDAWAKVKTAEIALRDRLAALDVDLEKIAAQDRNSARDMAKATSIMPQVVISVLFLGGYFTILGLFFSEALVIPMDDTFKILVGVMTAGVPQVLAFWLGSSAGSARKTDVMNEAIAAGRIR